MSSLCYQSAGLTIEKNECKGFLSVIELLLMAAMGFNWRQGFTLSVEQSLLSFRSKNSPTEEIFFKPNFRQVIFDF